jgi:hypothetical protein
MIHEKGSEIPNPEHFRMILLLAADVYDGEVVATEEMPEAAIKIVNALRRQDVFESYRRDRSITGTDAFEDA